MITKQKKIREDIAGKIFEWCKRNGFIVASFEWEELQGGTRGRILAITDIILEYEDSKGVVIRIDRELPNDCIYRSPKQEEAYCAGRNTVLRAGYVATEPIKEPKQ